jgi:hypothetical protein
VGLTRPHPSTERSGGDVEAKEALTHRRLGLSLVVRDSLSLSRAVTAAALNFGGHGCSEGDTDKTREKGDDGEVELHDDE